MTTFWSGDMDLLLSVCEALGQRVSFDLGDVKQWDPAGLCTCFHSLVPVAVGELPPCEPAAPVHRFLRVCSMSPKPSLGLQYHSILHLHRDFIMR